MKTHFPPEYYMEKACQIAKQAHPSPNPPVGCLIVKDGEILSSGYHAYCGGDHAERMALSKCPQEKLEGADLYVTLEPCSTHGRTPPCIKSIIQSKIKRVFYGSLDPTHANGGKTKIILKENDIEVHEEILREKTDHLIRFFSFFNRHHLTYTLIKVASSIDGRLATETGDSHWLSSNQSRHQIHLLRSQIDAILIGSKTLQNDNPFLTARLNNQTLYNHQPLTIVISSQEITPEFNIFQKSPEKIMIVRPAHMINTPSDNLLKNKGVNFLYYHKDMLTDLYQELSRRQIMSLLIEGGAHILSTFFKRKSFQELWVCITPHLIGGPLTWQKGFSAKKVSDSCYPQTVNCETIDNDIFWKGLYDHPPILNSKKKET